MKQLTASLFALASLAPLVFVSSISATTAVRASGADNAVKIIGGKETVRTKCEWYNFFQSANMWPKYKLCPGKNTADSYGFYLSDVAPSSILATFLKLNREQNAVLSGDFVSAVGSRQLTFKIGSSNLSASVCEWYNLFQSRYRTLYYLRCDGKTNRQSFGRNAEADFPIGQGPGDDEQKARFSEQPAGASDRAAEPAGPDPGPAGRGCQATCDSRGRGHEVTRDRSREP